MIPGSRRQHVVAGLLVELLAGLALGGCGGLVPSGTGPSALSGSPARSVPARPSGTSAPSPPAPSESRKPATSESPQEPDLLLLSGDPGAMALVRIAPDGHRTDVALPDPGVAWISTGAGGRIVATTGDGRLLVTEARPVAVPAWRLVRPAGIGPPGLPGPPAFGTLSPDGSHIAFVAADYGSGKTLDLVIVAVASGAATRFRVPRPPEGAPPAWAGARVIALTRERGDRPGVTLVDPTDGAATDGPGPSTPKASSSSPAWAGGIAALAVAGDGSTVAVARALDGPVEIRPADAWLSGRSSGVSVIDLTQDPDGARGLAWLALSARGDRLAVVRTDLDGADRRVEVYAAAGGWRRSRSIDLATGAERAVVAWLP